MFQWLHHIRLWIHYFFLRKKLNKLNVRHSFVNYSRVKTMLILADASKADDAAYLKTCVKQFENNGIKVEALVYIKNIRKSPAVMYDYITGKDINFFLMPKKERIEKYIAKRYDLVLNLYYEDCVPLEYISALSAAQFRIGRYKEDRTFCYDFMLDTGKEKNLPHMVQQFNHYLKMIDNHVKTA